MNFPCRLSPQPMGGDRWSFQVWAPIATRVDLSLVAPERRELPLRLTENGYWRAIVDGVAPGARYFYRLNGGVERPDPASCFQPDGVHQASEIVSPEFEWSDAGWFGIPLRSYILYELHVGSFTPEGTFDAIIPHLRRLKELGITALELMPVAQFPGGRNWGYDGVYLFAPQSTYGGPRGLKRLVNACHQIGLAVVLDVVYNHFGPEGNYLREFGPYFSQTSMTLWGASLNLDEAHSDQVRELLLGNALYWQTEFHLDALRLDAVHAIRDFSALTFLEELAQVCRRQSEILNRRFYLIAESDLNDPRLILPEHLGGYGLDAQWNDDFHHCLHVLLTGERLGYYSDFGEISQLAKIWREGFAFSGEYARNRGRRHGRSARQASLRQFVVFAQNHDQVGNRLLGERLSRLVSFEALKLAAGTVLLSPFIPLLFMGEEYGEPSPFQYITSHSEPTLIEAVREGRRLEFAHFQGSSPAPDPQAEEIFLQNKLDLDLPSRNKRHRALEEFYRALMRLRKDSQALANAERDTFQVLEFSQRRCLLLNYWSRSDELLVLLCFAAEPVLIDLVIPGKTWKLALDSSAQEWGGQGSRIPKQLEGGQATLHLSPQSLAVFESIRLTA